MSTAGQSPEDECINRSSLQDHILKLKGSDDAPNLSDTKQQHNEGTMESQLNRNSPFICKNKPRKRFNTTASNTKTFVSKATKLRAAG